MKSLQEFLYESLDEGKECKGVGIYKCGTEEEETERLKAIHNGCASEEEEIKEAEETIKSEDDFRSYAENKFKTVFGDKLDKDKMKKTIDGILADNKKKVEDGEFGELIGILNKAFGA